MNESVVSIITLAIFGFLLLWGAAHITLLVHSNAKGGRYKTRHFTRGSIEPLPIANQKKAVPVLAIPKNTVNLATRHGQSLIRHVQTVAVHEATQALAPTTSSTKFEQPVQNTQKRNFHGQDLRGVRLRGESLVGADLSYCNLVRANLAETDLSGANLAYSDLTNAILVGSDLSGCDCTGARFHGANLHGATLRNSNLTDTRFGPIRRHWAEVYSRHDDQRYPGRTVDVVGANLRYINREGATYTGSDILRGRFKEELYWTQW